MTASRTAWAYAAVLLASASAAHADSCDAIKAQVDSRIRSGGMGGYTLEAIDVAASSPGRVVGNCAGGARKIVMLGGTPGAAVPAPAASGGATTVARVAPPRTGGNGSKRGENLLTECNDGTMSVGGSCGR